MWISLTLFLALCGVVAGHDHHEHHHGEEIPLHEGEWVKDSPEELERKWSFEVSEWFLFFFLEGGRLEVEEGWVWRHVLIFSCFIPFVF